MKTLFINILLSVTPFLACSQVTHYVDKITQETDTIKIYISYDEDSVWMVNDTTLQDWVTAHGGGSAVWGSITGTITNQSDLQTQLDSLGDNTFWRLSGNFLIGSANQVMTVPDNYYLQFMTGSSATSGIFFEEDLFTVGKGNIVATHELIVGWGDFLTPSQYFLFGDTGGNTTFFGGITPLRYDDTYAIPLDVSIPHKLYVDSNLGGNPLSSIAQSPGAPEDGKVLVWDNTAAEWDTTTVDVPDLSNFLLKNTATQTITYEANPWSLNHSGNNVYQFVKSGGTGGMNFTNSSTSTGSISVVRQSSGAGSVVIANDNTGGGDVEIRRSNDSAGDVILRAQGTGNEVLIYQSTDIDNLSDSAGVNKKGLADYVGDAIDNGISSIVEDTSPQLGGALDLNGNTIGSLNITDTEVGYLNNSTSNIQGQLDAITAKNPDELTTIILDIGDWNMDANASVFVDINGVVSSSRIRSINIMIRNDEGGSVEPLIAAGTSGNTVSGTYRVVQANTDIQLYRAASGYFDNTSYDATSYNRGWITISYVP